MSQIEERAEGSAEKSIKVLVTGAAGYIGSVLCKQLLDAGMKVLGVDNLKFGGTSLRHLISHPSFNFVKADVRDAGTMRMLLKGKGAVVHLAAIVGDPACNKFPSEATQVMDVASKALFEACESLGTKRFVFASTCSNYGLMEGENLLHENSPLNPQSHYAKLKVGFEQYLMAKGMDSAVSWSILRFATVYGVSPRPRFDLTVNHFTRDMTLGKGLLVFGEKLWRPYCHVDDLARAVVLCLQKNEKEAQGNIYNIGDSEENYTKAMIVEAIQQDLPNAVAEFGPAPENAPAPRNYRVDFSAAKTGLGFAITKRVPDGIREVIKQVNSGLLDDPFDKKYENC